MPAKRRVGKARRQIDDAYLEDLHYGPGTCLFNGCGYLGPHGDGFWREKPADVQGVVLAEMREDWERHRAAILAAWEGRSAHDRYIAREYHGDPAEPWAQREFG